MSARILVLVDEFPKTPETFIVDHVAGLARSGFDVVVAARKYDAQRFAELVGEIANRVSFARIAGSAPRSSIGRLREMVRLRRWPQLMANKAARKAASRAARIRVVIDDISPDVVHAHFGPMGVAAALAIGDASIPLLVDFHGYDTTRFPRAYGWSLYRHVFGRLSYVRAIVHSPFTRDIIERQVGLELAYVNYGVDTSCFTPGEKGETWPQPIKLLSVGRLTPVKGHGVCLEAMARLSQSISGVGFELTVVGDGSARPEIEMLVADLGLTQRVRLTGALPPDVVAEEMRRADILVMASQVDQDGWQEAFGRVAIEAMAAGLPVVGTASGGLAFAIGQGGIVAEGYDAEAIERAVKQMMASGTPIEWLKLARERAYRFSIEQMDNDYARVTSDAAATIRSPTGG